MRYRGDHISSQDCLIGMACRDMVHPCDADRLELSGDHPCNANDPWCGSPNVSGTAAALWQLCGDDARLDLRRENLVPRLPVCIPNLMARERLAVPNRFDVIAVKATDIGGILSWQREKLTLWRKTYRVEARTMLLVHQESLDLWQEKLALRSRREDFYNLLRFLGRRTLLTSTGYSVYDDGSMCPVKQFLNLRMSLFEAARANGAGFPVIPTIGWNKDRPSDLAFISRWLQRQGGRICTVAVNAQTGTRGNPLALDLAKGMTEIEKQSGLTLHWVVFGGRKQVEAICEVIPRARITQIARPKDFQMPVRDRLGSFRVQCQLNLKAPRHDTVSVIGP